jgi:phospholipid transport system substrate-binding protein
MRENLMRFALALAAVVALETQPARAALGEAATVAHDLNASLLEVMKNAKTLGYAGRMEKVGPIIDHAFDVPFMAEKVIGRHWDTLDEAARQRWVALFREFLVANYAGRFNDYSGQTFQDVGEEPSAFDTVLVHTRLLNPPEENVDLNYRMHKIDAGWRVIDVILKGTVSELALRRSDYTAVIDRDGFAALETYLRAKIAALQAGKGEPIGAAKQ